MRQTDNKRSAKLTQKTTRTYRGVKNKTVRRLQARMERAGAVVDGLSYYYSFTLKGLKVYFCGVACGKDNQETEHEVTFIMTKEYSM